MVHTIILMVLWGLNNRAPAWLLGVPAEQLHIVNKVINPTHQNETKYCTQDYFNTLFSTHVITQAVAQLTQQ